MSEYNQLYTELGGLNNYIMYVDMLINRLKQKQFIIK